MSIRLQRVKIANIKGIEAIQFDVRTLTIISGRNGAGKTSIYTALLAVIDGGYDPGWLRRGAKKGTIELLLENGVKILTVVTAKGATTEVLTPDGGEVNSPRTYIKRLAESFRFNPALLLEMDDEAIAEEMLKIMPVNFTGAEINAALGAPLLPEHEAVGLKRFTEIVEGRRTKRTDTNRDLKLIEGSIATSEESLPPGDSIQWEQLVGTLQTQLSKETGDVERAKAEVALDSTTKLTSIKETLSQDKVNADADYNAKRLAIEEAHRAELDRALTAYRAQETVIQSEAAARVQAIEKASAETITELTGELASAQTSLNHQSRVKGLREHLEQQKARAREIGAQHLALETAVKSLENLERLKLLELPIEGVQFKPRMVKEGKAPSNKMVLYVNGIAWEHVNKSMRVRTAMVVASQALGELPLMVIDEAEVLDTNTKAILQEVAVEMGLQVILATVESDTPAEPNKGDLRVTAVA